MKGKELYSYMVSRDLGFFSNSSSNFYLFSLLHGHVNMNPPNQESPPTLPPPFSPKNPFNMALIVTSINNHILVVLEMENIQFGTWI